MEHVRDTFRLYYYGETARGVFRDGNLVCESIPLDDEDRFVGLLIYNRDEYEKAVNQWKSYWTWVENRNKSRWIDQEKGVVDYDAKNAMHCIRLLMSCESLLKTGEPIVRFEGDALRHLMDIRSGAISYEALMAEVESRMSKMEDAKRETKISHRPDLKRIDRLFQTLAWA